MKDVTLKKLQTIFQESPNSHTAIPVSSLHPNLLCHLTRDLNP